jgi:hypothetical protein
MTSTPITFTLLAANASFLAFSARKLLIMPRGVSMIRPAPDYMK